MRFERNEMEPQSDNKSGRNLGIFIPDYNISDILVVASSAKDIQMYHFRYIIQEFFAKAGLSLSCLSGFLIKLVKCFCIEPRCRCKYMFHWYTKLRSF